MNNIKVSVIIPVYNVEQYLRQCLDSVVNQTFKDIEIIVVNDCSPDNSLQIIKEYQKKDDRIVLVDLKQNGGLGNARNEGLNVAKGEYIIFVDSDDWITNNSIEILYKNIKQSDEDVVCSNFYLYENDTGLKKAHNQKAFCYNNIFNNVKTKQKLLTYRLIWSAWTKIYKRDFLLKNNIFFKRKTMEDILFFYEIILVSNKIKFIKDNLYFYRLGRKTSIMSNKNDRFYSCINLLSDIKNLLLQKQLFDTYEQAFYSYSYLLLAAELEVTNLPYKEIKQILLSLKKDLFIKESLKIKTYDKFFYKTRLFFFKFCFKYNINYTIIGKFLREIFLFFNKSYLLNLTKLKYFILFSCPIIIEVLGYLYFSPSNLLHKLLNINKKKKKTKNDNSEIVINQSKKILIVIDNDVPEYNIHAGARTIFQYLQIYVSLGFQVIFIPRDFIGTEPYTTELKNMGIAVMHGNKWKHSYKKWILANKENIHFVMLNRPRSIEEFSFFHKLKSIKIIYYGMDMHAIREYNNYIVSKSKKNLRAYRFYNYIEKFLYEYSSTILTVSKTEEYKIKDITCKNNVVTIPCFFYKEINEFEYKIKDRKDMLFVGGQQHTPNKDAVEYFCNKVMPFISEKKDIKINIVGKYEQSFINKHKSDNINFCGILSDKDLENMYLTSRLSIIPLRYGAGIKGKTVEAMKHGLPIITSDYGIEGFAGNLNDIAIIANSDKEFVEKILLYYDDEEKLKDMSKKEQIYIKSNFSYDVALNIMKEIYK